MLLDNDLFKIIFLTVSVGGLLALWGQQPRLPDGQEVVPAASQKSLFQFSPEQARKHKGATSPIDAALRNQMRKLSGRIVSLLTVGPSPSQLESATVRALGDLFTKVKIRSISDLPDANELVTLWRQDSTKPPEGLSKALQLGDLTVVQWLEPSASGLLLHTWYVKKHAVVAKDVYPWGEGTLPQETIDKLHQVILDPEMRIGG